MQGAFLTSVHYSLLFVLDLQEMLSLNKNGVVLLLKMFVELVSLSLSVV